MAKDGTRATQRTAYDRRQARIQADQGMAGTMDPNGITGIDGSAGILHGAARALREAPVRGHREVGDGIQAWHWRLFLLYLCRRRAPLPV